MYICAMSMKEPSPKGAEELDKPANKFISWLKRIGIAGFIFFLVKGLLWLIIPYLIAKGFWK